MGSLAERPKLNGGMIFYPRRYHIADDPAAAAKNDFAEGVDGSGRECVLYIHPKHGAAFSARDSFSAKVVPVFEDFADPRPGARRGCLATADNGPGSHEGILLAEQISYADEKLARKHPGKDVIVCRWASILTPRTKLGLPDGEQLPSPVIGKGFLEINFHPQLSDEAKALVSEWRELRQAFTGSASEEQALNTLADRIYDARKKWFVGTVIKPDLISTIERPSLIAVREAAEGPCNEFSKNGKYGGAILRVRQGDMVVREACERIYLQYDYKENKRPQTFEEAWSIFERFQGRSLARAIRDLGPGTVVDVIPVERINCGRPANELFGSGLGHDRKLMKTYVEPAFRANPLVHLQRRNCFLYADIAVRLAELRSRGNRGNLVVSAFHAWSSPKGNALTIGRSGEPEFFIDSGSGPGRAGRDSQVPQPTNTPPQDPRGSHPKPVNAASWPQSPESGDDPAINSTQSTAVNGGSIELPDPGF